MRNLVIISLLFLAAFSCKKSTDNPFDQNNDQDSIQINPEDTLDPTTFTYLHYKIFKPTCSNSGCHDGTFEPDFSSLYSSYESLVYHPIIKNNNQGTYTYRVMPGSANQSLLMERLNGKMDGVEDQMPIVVDPDSDWGTHRNKYIGYIQDWINAGAKDIYGDHPSLGNKAPKLVGVLAYADGSSTPVSRENTSGALEVPMQANSLELYFAFEDDSTQSTNLQVNEIKFSDRINDFGNQASQSLNILQNPVIEAGYFGGQVNYHHKITVNPQTLVADTLTPLYMRVYVQDSNPSQTEIPSNGSFSTFKDYASLIRKP